jgi:hypothetical protein
VPGSAAPAWSFWSLWSGSGWHRVGSGRCSTRCVLLWRLELLTLAQPPPRRRTADPESEVGLLVRHAPRVASATSGGPLTRGWQLTRFEDRLAGFVATRPMGVGSRGREPRPGARAGSPGGSSWPHPCRRCILQGAAHTLPSSPHAAPPPSPHAQLHRTRCAPFLTTCPGCTALLPTASPRIPSPKQTHFLTLYSTALTSSPSYDAPRPFVPTLT